MGKCAVLFCKNVSGGTQNVSYHRFPVDPERKRMWVASVRREVTWIPTTNHRICSLHFETECYNQGLKCRALYKNAVPTLNLPKFTHEIEDGNNSSTTNVETTEEKNKPSAQVNLGPSSSQVSNLSQKYGSPYQSAVSCVYGSGTGSPPPEHTAPSGDGKHTQLQVKRKRSGDAPARQPECLSCSECGVLVSTRVFVCVQCVDARMCAACEPHAHASHAVVRLPSTRVYNIVRDLFESLQAQLNCRLRGLHDDAEDELMDDLDDDELDQYIHLPAVKKTKQPVIAPSTSQKRIPPVASKVTFQTSPPESPMPTDEPMVMADEIKVEERDPLRETAAEGFMRITSDIVKSERDEETVAEPKLVQDVRADDTYIEINVPKSLRKTKGKTVGSNVTVERKTGGKPGSNVTVVRKPEGKTEGKKITVVRKSAGGNVTGVNKPAVKPETAGNTSIERAQGKTGSEIIMEIKQEPPEDACTTEVDSTGFIVFGSHRSIEGKSKKTS